MDRPIYIFTGFLDSGKTSAIKNVISDPYFTNQETSLIICFEEGDEEYSKDFLKTYHSNVEYLNFKDFNKEIILELDDKYNPDRIFIEFNGMDDDNVLLNMELPKGWSFAQMICIVDASKFKLQVKNMPQFMFNHVSKTEIVVLNRYEGADFKYLRSNIKSMNQYAVINLEDENHEVNEFPRNSLFDVNNLNISDDDYGLFYMDVIDNVMKYKDKKIEFNSFFIERLGTMDVFGRYAMVCCANDLQRFAIKVSNLKEKFTPDNYYHIKGIIRVVEASRGIMLHVEGTEAKQIEKPEQEYVSFN